MSEFLNALQEAADILTGKRDSAQAWLVSAADPVTTKRPIRRNTPEEEASIQRGIDADPDAREMTDEEYASARPASEDPACARL